MSQSRWQTKDIHHPGVSRGYARYWNIFDSFNANYSRKHIGRDWRTQKSTVQDGNPSRFFNCKLDSFKYYHTTLLKSIKELTFSLMITFVARQISPPTELGSFNLSVTFCLLKSTAKKISSPSWQPSKGKWPFHSKTISEISRSHP